MKIIFYSPHPTHDIVSEVGYATHQREVIEALRRAGHEVIPVIMGGTTLQDLNPLADRAYRASALKTRVKKWVPRWIWTTLNNYRLLKHDRRAAARLQEQIVLHTPDLLYERSEYLQDSGARMAEKYKLRYFLEVNAPFVEEMNSFEGYSLYHGLAHRKEAFKLKRANRVFVVSSALGEFIRARYGCASEKIVLQPNCIHPGSIQPDAGAAAELRRLWKAGDKKIIGFVGSMFPYHGVDLLIRAFARLHAAHPATLLLIVGDGIVLPALQKEAGTLGISSAVVFTGRIPHSRVFDYIAAMDICVMARSNWYGSPVKIFEYGYMGKPVIAPDTIPVRDVMTHGLDGLIAADHPQALLSALNTLLNDPAGAEQMARHFQNRVALHYTWDKAASLIIASCA